MAATENEEGWARNYRGKFGRMIVHLSGFYEYVGTVSLDAGKIAAEAMIFNGAAIRIGGTYRIEQLQIFEQSASAVTTPHKIPGSLLLFTPSDTSYVSGAIDTKFDMGANLDWEDFAGFIEVAATDYKEIKRGTEVIAAAQIKGVNLNIESYKDTRALVGIFVTKDDMTTKSIASGTKLYFKLVIKQD